jgi:hypothetical protein
MKKASDVCVCGLSYAVHVASAYFKEKPPVGCTGFRKRPTKRKGKG